MNPLKQLQAVEGLNPIFIEPWTCGHGLSCSRKFPLPKAEAIFILSQIRGRSGDYSKLSADRVKLNSPYACSNCEETLETGMLCHHSCRSRCYCVSRRSNVLCSDCYGLAVFQKNYARYAALVDLEDAGKRLIVDIKHDVYDPSAVREYEPVDQLNSPPPQQGGWEDYCKDFVAPTTRIGVLADGKFVSNEELFAQKGGGSHPKIWAKSGEHDREGRELDFIRAQSMQSGHVSHKLFVAFEDAVAKTIHDEIERAKLEMRQEREIILSCLANGCSSPPHIPWQKDPGMCVVCLSEPSTHAMVPCGHMCICEQCNSDSAHDQCPICRGLVENIIKIHNSGSPAAGSPKDQFDHDLEVALALSLAQAQTGSGESVIFREKTAEGASEFDL